MYWQFWSDVDRDFSLQVDRGDSQLRVTSENAIEEMTSLVSLNDDNDVGDANARKALSSLPNQKIGVELFTQARGAMPWTLMTPTGSDEGVHTTDLKVSRDGDSLVITYSGRQRTTNLVEPPAGNPPVQNIHKLSETDHLQSEVTLRVPIGELRLAGAEGRVPEFTYDAPPRVWLHIDGFVKSPPGWNDRPDPNAMRVGGVNEALLLDGSSVGDRDWARFEEDMRRRVETGQLVQFGNTDQQSAPHYIDLARSRFDLRINGETQRVGPPHRSHEHLLRAVNNDRQQAEQLSRLLDRYVIDDMCNLVGQSLGASYDQVRTYFKLRDYAVDIVSVPGHGDEEPYLDIRLSSRVRTDQFLDGPDGQYPDVKVGMRLKIKLSDLTNGTPENFEVLERAKLEPAPKPRIVDQQVNIASMMLRDGVDLDEPRKLQGQQHRLESSGLVVNLRSERKEELELKGALARGNGPRTEQGILLETRLLHHIDTYFQDNPGAGEGFWTLEMRVTSGVGGKTDHTLGIRVLRQGKDLPDLIEIFDPNNPGAKPRIVERDAFAGNLSRYIHANYGHVQGIDIYRAETKLFNSDLFVRNPDDQSFGIDRPFALDENHPDFVRYNNELREQLERNVQEVPYAWNEGPDAPVLYPQFWRDFVRSNHLVVGEGQVRVTQDNAGELLIGIVRTGDDQQSDKEAAKALSALLDQSLGNSLLEIMHKQGVITEDPPQWFDPRFEQGLGRSGRTYHLFREGSGEASVFTSMALPSLRAQSAGHRSAGPWC